MNIVGVGPAHTTVSEVVNGRIGPPAEHHDDIKVTPDTTLHLEWDDARFLGHHWLLGDIHVELNSDGERQSFGSIVPVGKHDPQRPVEGFYPAYNENELYFTIRIPRLGAKFTNKDPVRNSSEITRVPPYGSQYKLHRPVRFLSHRWWLPGLDIISCIVETMLEERLGLRVVDSAQNPTGAHVVFEIKNESGADSIEVVWGVQTPRGIRATPSISRLRLSKDPKRVNFDLEAKGYKGRAEVCLRAGILRPAGLKGAASDVINLVF